MFTMHPQRTSKLPHKVDDCVSPRCVERQPLHVEYRGGHRIECQGCRAATPFYDRLDRALEAWAAFAVQGRVLTLRKRA